MIVKNIEDLNEQALLVEILKILRKMDEKLDKLSPAHREAFHIIDTSDLLTLLKITERTAAEWRSKGILPYSKLGGKIYYRISDIEKALKLNLVNAKKTVEV